MWYENAKSGVLVNLSAGQILWVRHQPTDNKWEICLQISSPSPVNMGEENNVLRLFSDVEQNVVFQEMERIKAKLKPMKGGDL